MKLTLEQSRKLKSARMLLLAGVIVGPLYIVFADGFSSWIPYVNTLIIGVLIALIVALIELLILSGKSRKLSFYSTLFIRVFLYTIFISGTILLVMIFSRMLQFELSFRKVWQSAEFQNYLNEEFLMGNFFALALITIGIFIMQMRRKIGPKILQGFITGRYYHPRKVERIVMFIKVQNIKETIEALGRLKFFTYLNDIIFDVTETILFRCGDIYEYVENEIVVTWNLKKGIDDSNCIRTFFEIKDVLEARKIYYYETYGVIPELQASLHSGKLVIGEIGDIKSEIRYHGDVMNTTSRILGRTRKDMDFLISSALIHKLDVPMIYRKENIGKLDLRGKDQAVELFALVENEVENL